MPFSDIHQRFLYLPSLITADGNIKSLRIGTDLITDYAYDLNKNLTTIRTTLGGGSIVCDNKYTYDGNGNRLSKADRQGLTKYAYDDFGRLASTVTAEGDIQKNCYDAEGLRAEMDENAKTYYHYVSDEQGSVSHIIRDEDKESGVSAQGREQDRILNQYEYDAFGNTISCKEQVENRFRYMGEQYDPLTGQYYLRARYYNPVIARFTQEDTYYGDGLNLYTYCRNNPILNHDPTGHGTKENSPYSRKEQQYIDAGADPDTAKLAAQCYPDANSKQDLYNKYKSQGYNATDAKKLANYEIVHGEERAKNYAANNLKKSGPDYTATSPRDNVNTDWRTQERLNAQKKASNSQLMPMNLQFFAAKGDESGSKSGSNTVYSYDGVKQVSEYLQSQGVPRAYRKQILESFDVETIKLQTAGESTYGLRFYGGNANAEGRYLFETFSPLTNRQNLALPYEWNSMTGIQQFQVRNGTTMITGKAAAQKSFGSQYIGGANQWYINNLEDLIKCR